MSFAALAASGVLTLVRSRVLNVVSMAFWDTLAALRMAKDKGIVTMAIVNVVGSSIAREADKVFYTL